MPSEFDDLSKVRHVKRGDPVAEKPTAQPTRALELRLTQLESLVTSLTQSGEFGQLIIRNVPVKTGDQAVAVDDVVYFNANTGLYEKALAGVTFATGAYNSNPSSLVLGICVAVNGNVGDVMIAGYNKWRDTAQKEAMIEATEDYVPGVPYYLSDDEPGKVTRFSPALRIQVFMGTDQHYILGPSYSNPDSIETLYRVPMGMRPVGGVRTIPPSYDHQVVVGFDALELIDATPGYNVWGLTTQSSVSTIANFGYMVADARMTLQPAQPIYVRISVAVGGAITAISGMTLEELSTGGVFFNSVSLGTLSAGTDGVVRNYTLLTSPTDTTQVGTLSFKFTSDNTAVRRDVIFKVPDSFKGWKMINAPITPMATARVSGGAVVGIDIDERSVGYTTPPKVNITGTGTITTTAEAVAVLDEFGSIERIDVTVAGAGYTSATVSFDTNVSGVRTENGGSGAVLSLALTLGEVTGVTIVNAGSDYWSVPTIYVTDSLNAGLGCILQAEVTAGAISKVNIVSQGSGYTLARAYVRPSGVIGHIKTTPGIFQANMVIDTLSTITILPDPSAGGISGGWGYPLQADVILTGGDPTVPATATCTIDQVSRRVLSFAVTSPGSGYTSAPTVTVVEQTPVVVITGGTPTTNAQATVSVPSMQVVGVRIKSTGYGYAAGTTMAFVGGFYGIGTAAQVVLEIEPATGRIIGATIVVPGSEYYEPPTFTITDPGGVGNGFLAEVFVGSWPASTAVTNSGSGFKSMPLAEIGVPLARIEVEDGGQAYVVPPLVTVEPPVLPTIEGGVIATAVARLGGCLKTISIQNAGTGYLNPTVTVVGGGGTGMEIAVAADATGAISSVDIVDPGYGYSGLPNFVVSGGPGVNAVLTGIMEALDGRVIRIDLTHQGHGYTYRPQITIGSPPVGIKLARASAKMLGEGTALSVQMRGDGGIHLTQTTPLPEGNRLQIFNYADDLNDTPTTDYIKPVGGVFYYNIKNDLELLGRWPALPVSKGLFTLNGTELEATEFNETTGVIANPRADILFSKKTPMWTTFSADGCPWDREYRHYILDKGTDGNDALIDDTGPTTDEDVWWRFWEHVFKYEPNRNVGHMHINKASRFYQSGRLAALGTLAPLRLIDVVTGTESKNDGTLMTGQLLMVLDDQVNLMGGTGSQVDATVANNIVPIYLNNTGRPVFISSILLQVIYQLDGVSTPSVDDAALITIGTQDGNYRDIVGTVDPAQVTQQGKSTKLYRTNSVKEMLPDDRESSPLIMPNQTVYLRIDYPVNTTTIQEQALVAKIKGHVF